MVEPIFKSVNLLIETFSNVKGNILGEVDVADFV